MSLESQPVSEGGKCGRDTEDEREYRYKPARASLLPEAERIKPARLGQVDGIEDGKVQQIGAIADFSERADGSKTMNWDRANGR